MSKEITKTIEKTIAISEFDNKRCSRNCDYCIKTNGNYRCYLNSTCGDYQEIVKVSLAMMMLKLYNMARARSAKIRSIPNFKGVYEVVK